MWKPNREPDFEQFERVLRRQKRPDRLSFYEHVASPGFIEQRTGLPFAQIEGQDELYWKTYVEFWLGMGYDCVPMEVSPNLRLNHHQDTHGKKSIGSESRVTIETWADFENYPWPEVPMNFENFETAAKFLPDGAKIVGGVSAGPYEWSTYLLGVEGLSLAVCMEPELVAAVYVKLGDLYRSANRQLSTMDCIGALRQGDDLGFKTSTFLPPDILRQYVFPIYKSMAEIAHDQNKCFILHSCGNLAEVYDDLIDDCKIDAKHSFEDVILPVSDFKKQYGHRVTPLGGLDVDKVCQLPEAKLRTYTRKMVEECFGDGFWALGTGNSLTDYMPVDNYLIVLDEAMKVTEG
jgi:uroporphyrinogen decarboxylase